MTTLMGDQQRIHPAAADVEAPIRSEKRDPRQRQLQFGPTTAAIPPPFKPPKRSSCWCRCLCWTISLLILLLIVVGAIAGILYLCQGSIPRFYQGHQNRTRLNVALSGQNQYGRTLLEAIQEQQQTGSIPLDLKIDVPVRVKLGRLKLTKVRILGTCKLIVDSLSTNSLIRIKASTCSFGLKL